MPILNLWKNWELCCNWSLTVENKMGNLHKAGHISNLTWWMRYSISLNFNDLSMKCGYVFHCWKCTFEPIGNSVHITEFLTLGKALLILLPCYVQKIIMQISTQTDKQKYQKSVTTKKVHSLKKCVWGFETIHLTFYAK